MTTHTVSTTLPFQLGEPRSFQALTLIPLFPIVEPALEYVGPDEAIAYLRGLRVGRPRCYDRERDDGCAGSPSVNGRWPH